MGELCPFMLADSSHKRSRTRISDAPTLYILTKNSNCFPLLAAHLWVKNCKELMQSSYNKERLDQPLQASFWLRNFRTTNEHFLKEVCRGCQAVGLQPREIITTGSPPWVHVCVCAAVL